jgi:hypothetical protein
VVPPDHRASSFRAMGLAAVDQWLSCEFTVEKCGQSVPGPGRGQCALAVQRLVRRIAKDARVPLSTTGEAIGDSVGANFHDTDEFALGGSVGFWEVHSIGVKRFRP